MKPNFALNLSHEGISLLHRAKTGWLRVGDVALDAPDLEAQLNLLRRNATDLENGGLTTKLVIPNSQILYTEVDAPGPDTASRISQIRDGLVGLTPYDVSELVFDWRVKGKSAHVAVVARDTLREAEHFAIEYRFNPVSFVAVPINGDFEGEPFFGPTRHASELLVDGEVIEPDNTQIRILGQVGASPTVDAEESEKPRKKSRSKAGPKTEKPEKATGPKPKAPSQTEAPEPPEPQATEPGTPPEPDPELNVPAVTFTSRRKQVASPAARPGSARGEPRISLGSDGDNARPAMVTSATLEGDIPERPNGAARTPAFDIPGETRTGDGPALYATPAPKTPPATKVTPPKRSPAAPPAAARSPDKTPMPVTAPHTADVADPRDKASERRRLARQKAKSAGAAVIGGIGKLTRGAQDGAKRKPKPATPPNAAAAEAEAMTVFGARGRVQQRGKPKYLGLILTLLLLVALAVLALWSTYFMNDLTSGLFGTIDEEPEITAPAVIAQPEPLDPTGPATETAALPAPAETPVAEPEPEAPQTPIEAAVEAALTDPAEPLAEAAEPVAPEVIAEPEPEPLTQPAAEELALLTDPAIPAAEPEPPAPPEPNPETVVPEPIVSAPERQPPPTPAEAEARYAATGIWQLDPEPLNNVPGGGDQLEDIYVASIDTDIGAADAVALPGAGGLDTDKRPTEPPPPAPLGTIFEFDERGLIRATPDGALTPEGVPVISGAPPVVPGPRPSDLEVPVDETRLLQDERVRAFRPGLRPGGLAEANERARLGGFSSVELAAIRPKARPLSIQQQRASVFESEEEETQTAAIDPVFIGDDATALAVAASRAPPVRPSNFASVVERALQEATRAPPDPLPEKAKPEILASAGVAAPRMPPVPSRASVAKQATVRNAINLGKVNLIGIYGSPSKRRALVRLSSGKYVKVEVGDRVDGGKVAAIGNNELRYVKRGRNITLKMPKG